MNRFEYPVLLKAAAEGGFVVTCRDLPHLITQGEDLADALAEAADAMDEVFVTYMQEGMGFPAPSAPKRNERIVSPPAETVAKAALYVVMREAGITKSQLARRLGVDGKETRRQHTETGKALRATGAKWNAFNAKSGSYADEYSPL